MSATVNAPSLTVAERLLLSIGRMKPFLIWLAGFYLVWLLIVIRGGHWDTVISHWPIALAMSFGSYIAGSTPMGGGTVGFPVLVLIFDMPGSLGRNFGLAVQSIGMVSAGIFILAARRPLHWRLLGAGMLGSLLHPSSHSALRLEQLSLS